MKPSLRDFVQALSALCLLQGAPAFAQIVLPQVPPLLDPEGIPLPGAVNVEVEDVVPGNVITDVDTMEAQVQPVVSAVGEHVHNIFRIFTTPPQGNGAAADAGALQGIWLNYNSTNFENTFSRTTYEGGSDLALLGYDLALAENHLVGVALGTESTKIDTFFNSGEMETQGVTITPYYGWLFLDNFSFDLGFGYSDLDTEQFRVLPEDLGALSGTTVTSEIASMRKFATANLNGFWAWGDFSFSSRLGYLATQNEQEAYTESNDTVVPGALLEFEQTYIGADVAWGVKSQPYISLTLMKDSSSEAIVFPDGVQPADDDDSAQYAAGWRYYGEDVGVMLEWSERDGKDEYLEDGLWFTLRFNSE